MKIAKEKQTTESWEQKIKPLWITDKMTFWIKTDFQFIFMSVENITTFLLVLSVSHWLP